MAQMDAAAEQELLAVVEEGEPEEIRGAPLPSLWLRRAGLAILGTAALALVVLSVKSGAAVSAVGQTSGGDESINALIEATAVETVGRSLTDGELEMLAEHLPQAPTRQLVAGPKSKKLSARCQKDFAGHLKKMLPQVVQVGWKAVMSCMKGKETPACKTATSAVNKLKAKMKKDCIKEPSTDICVMKGKTVKGKAPPTQDACVPKTCQNPADLAVIANGGSLTCGAGGGPFSFLQNLKLPFR